MKTVLILLLALTLATPAQAQSIYHVPGATVHVEKTCYDGMSTVSYLLVATDEQARSYRIPDIANYPVISVLSTIPGDVALSGERLDWQPHWPGNVVVVVGGGRAECPTAESLVTAVHDTWLPLMLR